MFPTVMQLWDQSTVSLMGEFQPFQTFFLRNGGSEWTPGGKSFFFYWREEENSTDLQRPNQTRRTIKKEKGSSETHDKTEAFAG